MKTPAPRPKKYNKKVVKKVIIAKVDIDQDSDVDVTVTDSKFTVIKIDNDVTQEANVNIG